MERGEGKQQEGPTQEYPGPAPNDWILQLQPTRDDWSPGLILPPKSYFPTEK